MSRSCKLFLGNKVSLGLVSSLLQMTINNQRSSSLGRLCRMAKHMSYTKSPATVRSLPFSAVTTGATAGVLGYKCGKGYSVNAATFNSKNKKVDAEDEEDLALPNDSWSPETLDLYNKLKSEADSSDGLWFKVKWKLEKGETRSFIKCIQEKGKLFEYVYFNNATEKKLQGVLQCGPYTQGPRGRVHGGAVATVMDSAIGVCIYHCGYTAMTANLSVNYKVAIPLGSTVLVQAKIDRVEGRKIFGYAEMRSADGTTIYSTATALFIGIPSKK